MVRRGVTQREKMAAAANVQQLSLRASIDAVVAYLQEHPAEAGPCLMALRDGFMNPNAKELTTLRQFLPDSNSQVRHIALYFLEAFLVSIDSRLKDSALVEALRLQTKTEYEALGTPKEQQFSWAHRLFCCVTGAEVGDKLPTRHKAKLVAIYKERMALLNRKISDIPMELLPGKKCTLNYALHGIYSLTCKDESGRFHGALHCDGHKALASHFPTTLEQPWLFE